MTYLPQPVHYDQAGFSHLVSTLSWSKGWKPLFPTLHNTASPSLATYLAYSPSAHDRWGVNLNAYYRGKGWHSGPHLVATPEGILNLCDLEQDGVSVSCWNRMTIGIEMVGDFETERFDVGPGAAVRDNAVYALAVLSLKLGWEPDPLIVGKEGLHFHNMCKADHHRCPGKNVDRADVVSRVAALMDQLRGQAIAVCPSAPPVTSPVHPAVLDVAAAQRMLNQIGYRPLLAVDGIAGPRTERSLARFQSAEKLTISGRLDEATAAALGRTVAALPKLG